MSLRINQNIAAMSAHRWMKVNDTAMAQSIERLSSGFRINSAADDAAGLVISENLRTQVSGLTVAAQNTQDAINMFKTAEKALDEVEKQLRNIRDLTLHAASQNDNVSAKNADQEQVNQAISSINRIAGQTEFAGMKLFNDNTATNSIQGKFFQVGANQTQQVTFTTTANVNMHTSVLLADAGTAALASATSGALYAGPTADSTEHININWEHPNGTVSNVNVDVALVAATDTTAALAVEKINAALAGEAYTSTADPTVSNLGEVLEAYDNAGSVAFRLKDVYANQGEYSAQSQLTVMSTLSVTATGVLVDGEGLQFGVPGISAAGTTGNAAIDVTAAATTAAYDAIINRIDNALETVNTVRVNLGAFQKNNLESNLASVAVSMENLAASESAIRDTDMPQEMMGFTKSQILLQAGQAMMAQANQAPQSILQMLR